MIASLHGILASKSMESVVIDVQGVGYKVTLSLNSLSRLPSPGEKVFLFIHTSVREDDISLFGFTSEEEKKIFQKLIGVNGIGPKLALTILSGIGPSDLVEALHREDLARLTVISGVGKKTAERMILDLKDKLKELLAMDSAKAIPPSRKGLAEEATSALINLGYNRATAEQTISHISIDDKVPLEVILRQALKLLSEKNSLS